MTPAARVQRIQDEIAGVASLYGVTSWERDFMDSVKGRSSLSEKQEATLRKIETKVFEEQE